MSWAGFIKEHPPSLVSFTATVGPHSWGLNALQAARVRADPCCSRPLDAEDVPTQRKCGGKLDFFFNTLWLCEATTLNTRSRAPHTRVELPKIVCHSCIPAAQLT